MAYTEDYLNLMYNTSYFTSLAGPLPLQWPPSENEINLALSCLGLITSYFVARDLVIYIAKRQIRLNNRLTEMERNIELLRQMYTMDAASQSTGSEVQEVVQWPLGSETHSEQEPHDNNSESESSVAEATATATATATIVSATPTTVPVVATVRTPTPTLSQPQPQPQSQDADRHALLKRLLLNKEVHLKYKKTVFTATIIDKADAPHGYTIVCGQDQYNTPSHFSYAKKFAINPSIHSDNGWDSVYVVTGTNEKGKQTKQSIKEFIAASAQVSP
jgi:hypothetical protein